VPPHHRTALPQRSGKRHGRAVAYQDVLTVPPEMNKSNPTRPPSNSSSPSTPLANHHVLIPNAVEQKHTLVDVGFADGSTLTATDHHPFWDATTGVFTDAIDLHPGDKVREPSGRLLFVRTIHAHVEDVTAYNLTVDGFHTYYAGTTPILTHNTNCPVSAGVAGSEPSLGSGNAYSVAYEAEVPGNEAFRVTGAHGV
jgi:hypothetical protein